MICQHTYPTLVLGIKDSHNEWGMPGLARTAQRCAMFNPRLRLTEKAHCQQQNASNGVSRWREERTQLSSSRHHQRRQFPEDIGMRSIDMDRVVFRPRGVG